MSSFYSLDELQSLGLKSFGSNVLISKKASLYNPSNISIGNNVRIDDFSILSGNITLGDYIHISAYCSLFAGDYGIEMYDFSTLSVKSTIFAVSDYYSGICLTNPMIPDKYRYVYGGKVTLEKHVIIGASTVILPNITIKEGAAIGACSLISKDCEPWIIYAGIPAKKLKERKKDLLTLEKTFLKTLGSEKNV